MTTEHKSLLWKLLSETVGEAQTEELFHTIEITPALLQQGAETRIASRAVVAQAMTMILFRKLVDNVPEGRRYVSDKLAGGEKIVFDHGAVRTVCGVDCGALPEGRASIARILEPLGFERVEEYPLARLKMMGHAYCHADLPEDIAQFFVSELDTSQFSDDFRAAAERVIKTSRDPLSDRSKAALSLLADTGALPTDEAPSLLADLARAFDRQHSVPTRRDYEILKTESDEMAWIATEGTFFNHLTDRVADVEGLADQLRAKGQPIKDKVEVSKDKTVLQTAYKATMVRRYMIGEDGTLTPYQVPGSFVEFITRHKSLNTPDKMDLRFDSSNAQGIFKMTAAAAE
ncbi:2-oxoadipate dioxygenase/decarboxylase family protein [Aestuariispira insulae]|uniref:2-oxoadipate dioxygenase/decarboxylase n=1 Tax=Aestuariispira insulae TaxID=1461337 RepID=A0A3D9HN69_9PROT|nr:DUF1338 family protein [Aestuariispira insulae]RED50751.1 uncharacterized protein DUF1338 [Aestuariispira insulae]